MNNVKRKPCSQCGVVRYETNLYHGKLCADCYITTNKMDGRVKYFKCGAWVVKWMRKNGKCIYCCWN